MQHLFLTLYGCVRACTRFARLTIVSGQVDHRVDQSVVRLTISVVRLTISVVRLHDHSGQVDHIVSGQVA